MGWRENLLDASFRGVRFDVLRTSDRGERALVEHEYPYRAGAEIEDMGRKARRISITAVFYGHRYEYGLRALLRALEVSGAGRLIHPVFGPIMVCAGPYTVPHDAERPDYCEVELEFVEAALDNTFLGSHGRQSAAELFYMRADARFLSAQLAMEAYFCLWLPYRGWSSAQQLSVLGVLYGVIDLFDSTVRLASAVISYITSPLTFIADLASAMTSVAARLLPLSSFSAWASLSALFSSADVGGGKSYSYISGTSQYTTQAITGIASGSATASPFLENSASASTSTKSSTSPDMDSAVGSATAMAAVLSNITQTSLLGQAVTTMLNSEITNATLTVYEVEALVGNVRQRIQDCIDDARLVLDDKDSYDMIEALRDAAYYLQELGAEVIAILPPLTTHTVTSPCNLHLLAHRLYGDYSRADEIARLNPSLINPNFVGQGQKLVVYGS